MRLPKVTISGLMAVVLVTALIFGFVWAVGDNDPAGESGRMANHHRETELRTSRDFGFCPSVSTWLRVLKGLMTGPRMCATHSDFPQTPFTKDSFLAIRNQGRGKLKSFKGAKTSRVSESRANLPGPGNRRLTPRLTIEFTRVSRPQAQSILTLRERGHIRTEN
jgi:hypothetical protein